MDDIAQEVVFVAPRVEEDGVVMNRRDSQFHVDFNFSCDLLVCHYYDNNEFLGDILQPNIMSKSVRLEFRQLMNSEYLRRIINQELREWPLDDDHRRNLSEFALDAAKDRILLTMPPHLNALIIPITVLVVCNRRVDENYLAVESMTQLSMREPDSRMVPATDSSIESLEIKTTTSHESKESCPICLEDFYAGCQVLSMPCSHIFHEDCIKKWLKSSHYCPICRFEMPIS